MSDPYFDAHYQTFYLKSTGDYWHNRDELIDFLQNVNDDKNILLHFQYQGFSMKSSGLLALLRESAKNKPFLGPTSMLHIQSPNREEDHYGYYNLFQMPVCDEFLRCQNYWVDTAPVVDSNAKRFAHMIGRPTLPRIKMFWDMRKFNIQSQCFESMLEGSGPGLWNFPEYHYDQIDDWFDDQTDASNFCHWFCNHKDIKSFDGCKGTDQPLPEKTVRLNAVKKSHMWHIDIVFESLTVGETFAPTEKLIRSLITEKPFIVYAAPGYLQKLQQIGFRTFNDFWDESYDQYQLQERYNRILDLVLHLNSLDQKSFTQLIDSTKEVVQHNKNILKQLNIDFHGSMSQWINKVEPVS